MKYWEPLTNRDLNRLHASACGMLEDVGMRIRCPEAMALLVQAGGQATGCDTIRIPRTLVEKAIQDAPETFSVYDRRGGSLEIGGTTTHHLPGGTMTEVLEYPAWHRRPSTLNDVRQFARLTDALDCLAIGLPVVEGRDAPAGMGEIMTIAELLKNTSKFCFVCPVEARAAQAAIAMAKAIKGTNDLSQQPTIGLLTTLMPGYEMDNEAAQTLLLGAREGLPLILMGGSIAGAQGPATIAGSFVMQIAEELAALTMAQTARPGTPCLLNWSHMKLDMRFAEIEVGHPEYALAIAAGAQMARRYGIPSYACPAADSKTADFQAAFEFTMGIEAALLAGINVTVNAGTASKASAASYELLILHNEILRSLLRFRRKLTISKETLALDMQKEAGFRGDYLTLPHTMRHIRDTDEFSHKDIFDATGIRNAYEDPCQRAQARWQQLLRSHSSTASASDQRTIESVVTNYRQMP